MTFDPSIRGLVGLMDELAAGDDGYVEDILAMTVRTRQRRAWMFTPRLHGRTSQRFVLAITVAGILIALAAMAVYVGTRPRPPLPTGGVSNGWIAFSSMPGVQQTRSTDARAGSDIYLVREGSPPIILADRLGGTARNVCPTFSPDGRTLAYGSTWPTGRAVMLIDVSHDTGPIEATRRAIDVPGPEPEAPCPRWSADGKRIGYLLDGAVTVRLLDGSVVERAPGDPGIDDYAASEQLGPLVSPAGDRIAQMTDGCRVTVSATDGTDARVAPVICSYALGTWSPDGNKLLFFEDVTGRDFTLHQSSVAEPGQTTVIAPMIPVNGSRSWPNRLDVTWQPVFD